MKNNENVIEKYLRSKFKLDINQLQFELARFERHPDIGLELSVALQKGRFPKADQVLVCVDGVSYSASMLYKNHYASTIYGAYSLLAQLREHPDLVKEGFKIK